MQCPGKGRFGEPMAKDLVGRLGAEHCGGQKIRKIPRMEAEGYRIVRTLLRVIGIALPCLDPVLSFVQALVPPGQADSDGPTIRGAGSPPLRVSPDETPHPPEKALTSVGRDPGMIARPEMFFSRLPTTLHYGSSLLSLDSP